MKYVKGILVWVLIIPIAMLNGALRDNILTPELGSDNSLLLSGLILSACIFIIAIIFIPKLKLTFKQASAIGLIWFLLTNLFDILLVYLEGNNLLNFFEAFDVSTGNLWIVVILSSFFAPVFARSIKK